MKISLIKEMQPQGRVFSPPGLSRLSTLIPGKILLLVLLINIFQGCQQELEDRYLNPDRTNDPGIDKLFTALLDNNRVRPSYWEISTFVNWHIGVYTQSVGFLNSTSLYQQNERYIQDRWDDFYKPGPNGAGVVAQFREMERAYAGLDESLKPDYEIFMKTARVVLYDQACQMVDLWGDIPFSKAGMLNKTGKIEYPAFDAGADVYAEAISELESLSRYFSGVHIPSTTEAVFRKQDILLNGDMNLWRRYCNSLRLRLLMRVSFVHEPEVKEQVLQLLGNPADFPLLGDGGYVPGSDDILLAPLATHTDDLQAAFADWVNYPAPYFMLEKVLKPSRDLRIPALFDRYGTVVNNQFQANIDFNALPLTLNAVDQQKDLGKYAIMDSVTFLHNSKLPGVVMTVAEVNFLKAEAFERWGGGSADEAFRDGVRSSIWFYYYLNSNGSSRSPLSVPSKEEVEDFVNDTALIKYEGTPVEKLASIWTQKWVHFGFMQSVQSWAELRRTGYPQLYFPPAPLMGYELPPQRLTYPGTERTFNTNYTKVAANDLRTSRIFWDVN